MGGTGKDKGKRHPTLGKNVTVGCGAKILGPFKVGDGAKVAANAVLLESIPPASTAVGVPARIARVGGRKPNTLDHVHLPDPVAQEICKLQFELDRLEKRIRELEKEQAAAPADDRGARPAGIDGFFRQRRPRRRRTAGRRARRAVRGVRLPEGEPPAPSEGRRGPPPHARPASPPQQHGKGEQKR